MKYFTLQAVKQDIVRSLASRLELHWDSLIEEEQGSPEGMLLHMYNSEYHQHLPIHKVFESSISVLFLHYLYANSI
jgi:hypothetical protein